MRTLTFPECLTTQETGKELVFIKKIVHICMIWVFCSDFVVNFVRIYIVVLSLSYCELCINLNNVIFDVFRGIQILADIR